MVERAACGVTVPPEDGPALAVRRLAADREAARRMGERGRSYALAHYDRAALAARFVETVALAIQARPGGRAGQAGDRPRPRGPPGARQWPESRSGCAARRRALYRQRRVGYAGAPFTLLKFRTMVVGAEGMGAGLAVSTGDERITRAGRTLRRLSSTSCLSSGT